MNLRNLGYVNPYQAHPEFSFNDGLIDDNECVTLRKDYHISLELVVMTIL